MRKHDKILETERLILWPVEEQDIPALVDLWCDPEVTCFMGGPRDPEKLKVIFEMNAADPFADTYDMYPVEEKASGSIIGHCGLLDKEVDGEIEIELVYVLARSAWGNGYATEISKAIIEHAFKVMGVTRLIALVDRNNKASEKVAARLGMQKENEVIRPGGEPRQVYVLANPYK